MRIKEKRPLGLYLHIPFCRSKCAYCDFFSFVPQNGDLVKRYVSALLTHMHQYKSGARDRRLDTVFIGGGTPTSIGIDNLCDIIRGVRRCFSMAKHCEFTVEVNPATASYSDFVRLRRLGVNRLSIGLQSANNRELLALTRLHSRSEFERCYRDARRAGIENINIDLMYGVPSQTQESFMNSLAYVVSLQPEHISMYCLKVEEGTPFAAKRAHLALPNDDAVADMYIAGCGYLAARGYEHYEISNFAKSGYRCAHNMKYWNCEEYLGLGPAAHSYYNGSRFSFKRNLDAYMNAMEIKGSRIIITENEVPISPRERVGEYVMLRLRLSDGIDCREFERRFGLDFRAMFGAKMAEFARYGLVNYDGYSYSLTERGFFVSNAIISELVQFNDDGSIFVG